MNGVRITWAVNIIGLQGAIIVEADSGESIAEGIANLFDALPEKSQVWALAIIGIKGPDAEPFPEGFEETVSDSEEDNG